ncbi:putative surface protease GP63 [Trypanosoma conorhini]|uniref:Leishmanolysin-like peptidase n=1 Tax=Trypanosoma conorhini TaxID=83891 RepID=A0A3R7M752_9TRYP|nr:putative surface protease GP63 [Trypanosoma conorhini]RNE97382.1 putative surface protease GP63 [Trypanosoma conorhini]
MPRLHRLVAVPLLLLLCWLRCSLGFVEHRCTFDERMRSAGALPVTRELPRKGQGAWEAYTAGASSWEPIRIKAFTEDMKSGLRYCTAAGDLRPDFEGGIAVCRGEHVLTPEKKALLVAQLLPESIQLHANRLLVRPMGLFFVQRFTVGACAFFTVPEEHHTVGVVGADFVLYVAAGPTMGANVAWGAPCSVTEEGRPVVGALNFGPQHISTKRGLARAAAHEIAHTLGFSAYLFAERSMVTALRNVRGKAAVVAVSSKRTLAATRRHFNCAAAPGMELEDEGGEGTAQSHWERRNAKDELMAGVAGVGYYTALTMAAFEDTGFYRANWGMEEPMAWGNSTGCEFLQEACVQDGSTRYPDMFCTGVSTHFRCTSDHLALGVCSLTAFQQALAPPYRYFGNPAVGAPQHELTDRCPVIAPVAGGGCTTLLNTVPGSRVGSNSRCVDGSSLHVHAVEVGAVCVEVSCEGPRTLRVRHAGDERWHLCPEGGTLRPGPPFTAGHIVCPKYARVCATVAGGSVAVVGEGDAAQRVQSSAADDAHRDNVFRREAFPQRRSVVQRAEGDASGVAGAPTLPWLLLLSLLCAVR